MSTVKSVATEYGKRSDTVGEFLTFTLAGEQYAFEVSHVREVRGWEGAAVNPDTPDYVLGITNIRGDEVYVIDLRRRLALENTSPTRRTCVVVLGLVAGGIYRPVGFAVDAVAGIRRYTDGVEQPRSDFRGPISREHVRGLATVEGRTVTLLETESLIDYAEINHRNATRAPGSRRVH